MNIQPPGNFRGGRPLFGPVGHHGGPPRRFVRRHGPPDPLAQAWMRYANGEISREEYLQVTKDLGGAPEELPPD